MKTALKTYIDDLKEGNCKGEQFYLDLEKEQHEKIAIDMVNIALDNLNNLDVKMEQEFNNYYSETFKKQ